MAKINQKTKRMVFEMIGSFIFGMIGALVGVLPVSILKTIIIFSDFDWLCMPIGNFRNKFFEFDLSTCGLMPNGGSIYLIIYLFFILFGGALFGIVLGFLFIALSDFLRDYIWSKRFQKHGLNPTIQNGKYVFGQSVVASILFDLLVFGQSFAAGILFDLLFVFIYLSPY